SKKQPCLPFTIQVIKLIHEQLDLSDPMSAAVFACLTTTFYTTARLGEFTTPSLTTYNPAIHPSIALVHTETDCNGLMSTIFKLPKTKSSPHGEDVLWSVQHGPSDPHFAWTNHLNINNPSPNQHIFAYQQNKGKITTMVPLTQKTFLTTINKALMAGGQQKMTGHSIRIGATLEYLLQGVPFDAMKVKGRWASDTFRIYLWKHTQILTPYMQAVPDTHTVLIHHTINMPPVR
ncbi:hypothetical protein SERLA73DRAFT_62005, partial [Serpula lacrymans var. lacrymans S7.3]